MADVKIKFACGLYDRMLPLFTGEVTPKGIDFDFTVNDRPRQIFHDMTNQRRFDASEMSCSEFFTRMAAGDCPLVAIPVFSSRVFRHSSIVVNRKAGIETPKDLEGKRVGCGIYSSTAAVYVRGLLQHEYGVDLGKIHWIQGNMEQGGVDTNPTTVPPRQAHPVHHNDSGKSLRQLLEAGEIDATLGSNVPKSLGRHPDLVRLFPNFREVEAEYYRRTGIFPIMHLIVIRRDVYDRHPAIAASLYEAFCQSRDRAAERMRHQGSLRYMLPWMWAEIEEIDHIFGSDPWPYGVEPNRAALEVFMGYLADQAMIEAPMAVEDLFVPI